MDGEWEAPLVENPKCTNAPGCGKWSAPLITNPNYKVSIYSIPFIYFIINVLIIYSWLNCFVSQGVWRAPMIPNPQYQGKWAPKKIVNPHFFRDENPFRMTTIVIYRFIFFCYRFYYYYFIILIYLFTGCCGNWIMVYVADAFVR